MSDVFLGVIALAVVVMATLQVAIAVVAARAARRVGRLVDRLEGDLRPIVSSLQAVAEEAAKAASSAAAQMDRMNHLTKDLTTRVEETAEALQSSILAPVREGVAVIEGLKAVISSLRDLRGRPRERRSTDEEDPLFIG